MKMWYLIQIISIYTLNLVTLNEKDCLMIKGKYKLEDENLFFKEVYLK